MNKKQFVSLNQAAFLLAGATYGGLIYMFPEIISRAGRAAWLAIAACSIPIIILVLWMLFLTKFYPGKTIFEILQTVAGKLAGGALEIIFVLMTIIISALNLRQFASMIKVYFLHVAPVIFPIFLTLATAAAIASKGLEPLARTTLILIIITIFIAFGGLSPGIINLYDWSNIFPIFDRDLFLIIDGGYLALGLISETLLFLMVLVAFYPRPIQKYLPLTMRIVAGSVIIPSAFTFYLAGLISPEEISRVLFVGVQVAQAVHVGKFLHGLEVFILIAYECAVIIKLAINIHAGKVVGSHLLGGKYPKIIFSAIVVAIFFLCLMVSSINEANYYYSLIARFVLPPFILTVLILTSIGVLIKGKKESQKS